MTLEGEKPPFPVDARPTEDNHMDGGTSAWSTVIGG